MQAENNKGNQQKSENVVNTADLHSLITDVALAQYSNEWSRVGNLQTSAGSLLAIVSIAASVGFSSIPTDGLDLSQYGCVVKYSFPLAFIMSVVYFVLSVVFMFFILHTKFINGIKHPTELKKMIDDKVQNFESDENKILYVVDFLIELMDLEIKNVETILCKNRYWYTKCLLASFLSLGSSLCLLLFSRISVITTKEFGLTLIGVFCYLFCLSLILIFIFPRRKECKC